MFMNKEPFFLLNFSNIRACFTTSSWEHCSFIMLNSLLNHSVVCFHATLNRVIEEVKSEMNDGMKILI